MAKMINCPHCRRLTDPNLDGCPHCGGRLQKGDGEKLPGTPKHQICPKCKALVQEGDIICVACGTNLLTGHQLEQQPKKKRNTILWVVLALIAIVVGLSVLVGIYFMSRDPVQRAMELSAQGRDLEAAEILEEYVARAPDDKIALFALGKLQWRANKSAQAAQTFQLVTELEPANVDAFRLAAVCYAKSGLIVTLDKQIAALERVVSLAPDDAEAWYNLALARGTRGDLSGQIEALNRTIQIQPNNGSAMQFLGIAHVLRDSYAEAERALNRALSQQGSNPNEVAAALGFLAEARGDTDETIRRLEEALSGPLSVQGEAQAQLGMTFLQQGRWREGEQLLQRAATHRGALPSVPFFRALALEAQGYTNDALTEYQIIVERSAGPQAASAAVQMAHIHLMRQDTARARDAVDRARQLDATSALFHVVAGRVHAQDGDFDRAEAAFKRAIQVDPTFAPAHLESALLYIKREQFPPGLSELELYLDLQPGKASLPNLPEIRTLAEQIRLTLEAG